MQNKIIDITKNFGVPLAAVGVILLTSWKLSTQISDFKLTQETRYIELSNKLDNLQNAFTLSNNQNDKKIAEVREYTDSKLEILNLKAENFILNTQILNPTLKFPDPKTLNK